MSSLTDFAKNASNTNKGNDRGRDFVKRTIGKHGWAGAMVADNEGNLLDGNHRIDIAKEQGAEPIVVKSDGTRPIIIQREDVEPGSPTAQVLKTAINRSADLNHNYDYSIIESTIDETGTSAEEFGFSAQEVLAGGEPNQTPTPEADRATSANASDSSATNPAGTTAQVPESFQVMVEVECEEAQQELYDRLTTEGFKCRVLTL